MTEQPSMNVLAHTAFRRDLSRFDSAFASFPAGSRTRADQLQAAWKNYEHQLHHHHTAEETLFWPALEQCGADVSVVAVLDQEHAAMRQALDAASAAMARFHDDPTADAAAAARVAVGQLRDVLVAHLDHEERDLEPIAMQFRDSAPIEAAQKGVRQQMKGQAGTYIAWLLDGASNQDRATLNKVIPAPVVFMMNTFGGRDYRKTVASVWAVQP